MNNILKDKERKDLTKEDVYIFLHKWLKEQISLSQRESISELSFDKPAWSEYQAYQLGIQKAFSKLTEIIPDQGKE